MHTGVQRKYVSKLTDARRASREKTFPTRLHRPVQRKYATKAAHGPRGEQGENLPCSIAQARIRKFY